MAKETEKTLPRSKEITFAYTDERGITKDYTLAFTRKSVERAENNGFVVEDLDSKPVSTFPKFFHAAFLAHHPFIKREQTDEIFFAMDDRAELISMLVEMYRDTLNSLVENEEPAEGEDLKNITWKKNW